MSEVEDPYGNAKRLAFCTEAIDSFRPKAVLDIGCGTGDLLTRPLALRFPGVRFLGVDSDAVSILHAQSHSPLSNLEFAGEQRLSASDRFDLIIASEVIEHVESPDEFIAWLRAHLTADGRMIVTLPNGRGPFEMAMLIEALLRSTGLFGVLRWLKRHLVGGGSVRVQTDTLASSPHINFFSLRQIGAVFARAGLRVERFRPRTFLCGFGFDSLIGRFRLTRWNARIADRLPLSLASAWMFVLAPQPPVGAATYRRGWLARWRRRLNERTFGAA